MSVLNGDDLDLTRGPPLHVPRSSILPAFSDWGRKYLKGSRT